LNLYSDIVNPVASTINNGQQWDSPNVWAPNNWILHEVIPKAKKLKVAQQWVSTVYCSWSKSGLIYEKYRSDRLGERGQGGEYAVQAGFGWTNGLVLYYLSLYGAQLQLPTCP
jgi:alpha,alpha-trehalase